jgi:hypothetical protein
MYLFLVQLGPEGWDRTTGPYPISLAPVWADSHHDATSWARSQYKGRLVQVGTAIPDPDLERYKDAPVAPKPKTNLELAQEYTQAVKERAYKEGYQEAIRNVNKVVADYAAQSKMSKRNASYFEDLAMDIAVMEMDKGY